MSDDTNPAGPSEAHPGGNIPAGAGPDGPAPEGDNEATDASPDDREMLGATEPEASDPSTEKDPSTWVTGDEPMTGAQRSYLDTLAREAGEQIPADLTKAEASEHIDRLQSKTGRGEG